MFRFLAQCAELRIVAYLLILRNSLFENSPDLFAGSIIIDVNVTKASA